LELARVAEIEAAGEKGSASAKNLFERCVRQVRKLSVSDLTD
jgi:hypothetical protein